MAPKKYTRKEPARTEDSSKTKTKTSLPTDDKDYKKAGYSDLKKGDYIMYEVKPRTYQGKDYPAKVNQGFVSMLQNEVGDALWKDQEGKVLGMTNYGKSWTNNTKDIGDIYKQTEEAALAKKKKGLESIAKKAPERAEKRKIKAEVEAEVLDKEKKEAKLTELDADALKKLAESIQTELKSKKRRVTKTFKPKE